jgi:hypothetical protein
MKIKKTETDKKNIKPVQKVRPKVAVSHLHPTRPGPSYRKYNFK